MDSLKRERAQRRAWLREVARVDGEAAAVYGSPPLNVDALHRTLRNLSGEMICGREGGLH